MSCTELLPNHSSGMPTSEAVLPLLVFTAYFVTYSATQCGRWRLLLRNMMEPARIVRCFVRTASAVDMFQCLAVLIFSYLDLSFALGIITFVLFDGYPPKSESEELCGTEIARWAAGASP